MHDLSQGIILRDNVLKKK